MIGIKKGFWLFEVCLFLTLFSSVLSTINWSEPNPRLEYDDKSIKDATMGYDKKTETYFVAFSSFYNSTSADGTKKIICHVVGVTSKDMVTFSDPLFTIDGLDRGQGGMCSPNLWINEKHISNNIESDDDENNVDPRYILTMNSWGDLPNKTNSLFYMSSNNLMRWNSRSLRPLAAPITKGKRAIDAAVGWDPSAALYYLIWKERITKTDVNQMATAPSIRGPWKRIGEVSFRLKDEEEEANATQENYEFFWYSPTQRWVIVSSDYGKQLPEPRSTWLYFQKEAGNWLEWENGRKIEVKQEPGFNTFHMANAGFIHLEYDDIEDEVVYYMIYAGNTERKSFAYRGHNRLGMAKSKDLRKWIIP
eukprot:Awhi_evm1s7466